MTREKAPPLTDAKKSGFFYGYVMVGAVLLIIMVGGGVHYSFGIFFKPLVTEFGWSSAATSGVFSLYMVLHGVFLIFIGRMNDRFGPRAVLTVTSCSMGLGLILISQISSLWQLYLIYGVMLSLGASGTYFPMVSTITRWFVKKRGLMTGIAASGAGMGEMVFPPVASQLILNYGWRTSYVVLGIAAWVIMILAAQLLRRDPPRQHMSESKAGVPATLSPVAYEGFSVPQAMRTRQFWLVAFAFFSFGLCIQAVMVHIVPHIIDLGITATVGATILTVIGGTSIVGRISTGTIGDRLGSRAAFTMCFILIAVALGWLLFAQELWKFYLFAVVFGFAYGGTAMIHSPLVADLFGLKSHGAILGIIGFVVVMGGAVGAVLAGFIYDLTGGYQPAFIIFCVLSLFSLVLGLFLTPVRGRREDGKP